MFSGTSAVLSTEELVAADEEELEELEGQPSSAEQAAKMRQRSSLPNAIPTTSIALFSRFGPEMCRMWGSCHVAARPTMETQSAPDTGTDIP